VLISDHEFTSSHKSLLRNSSLLRNLTPQCGYGSDVCIKYDEFRDGTSNKYSANRCKHRQHVHHGGKYSNPIKSPKELSSVLFHVVSFTDLQELMGSLLYIRHGLENSPYAHLLDPVGWTEIADIFRHDACAMLGLSVDSPLSIV